MNLKLNTTLMVKDTIKQGLTDKRRLIKSKIILYNLDRVVKMHL